MRKFLPYILMIVFVGIFFVPVSLNFQKNEAQAQAVEAKNYSAAIEVSGTTASSASMLVKIQSKNYGDYKTLNDNETFFVISVVPTVNTSNQPIKYFGISPKKIINAPWYLGGIWTDYLVNKIIGDIPYIYTESGGDDTVPKSFSTVFIDLIPNTEYTAGVNLRSKTELISLTTSKFTTTTVALGGTAPKVGSIVNLTDLLPKCGITGDSSIYGCIIQVFYYAFWMPTSFLASLAGKIMDFFIFYSISSASYSISSFVVEGWKVVRDIANISFIFVLLYIALRTILNLGSSESKKMITWVVVIALIINFSLFFTRVIVDSGNILAGVVYNNIGSMAKKDGVSAPIAKGAAGEEQISVGLVNQFDPQKIIASAGVTPQNVDQMKTPFLVVVILATIINLFMIFTFLAVCLMFVGRTVGLMIAMIFSPLAFVSVAVPGSGKILQQFSWNKWFPELVSMAFMAPVFIFFLWLIMLFLNVGLLKGMGDKLAQDGNLLGLLIAVCLPFIIIIALLTKAKTVAKEMAGDIGTALNSMVGKAIGVAGGVALGGIALAGRATVGRAGSYLASRGAAEEAGAAAAGAGPTFVRPPTPYTGPIRFGGPRPPVPPAPPAPKALLGPAEPFARPSQLSIPSGKEAAPIKLETPKGPVEERSEGEKAEAAARMTFYENRLERQKAAGDTEGAKKTKETIEGIKGQAEEELKRAGQTLGAGLVKVPVPAVIKPTTEPIKPAETPKEEKKETAGPTLVVPGAYTGFKRAEKVATPTPPTPPTPPKRGVSLKDRAAAAPESVFGIRSKEDIKNITGKHAFNMLKYLGGASFDLRNTKLMKSIGKNTGIDFGKARGKGGFDQAQADIIKNKLKYAEKLEASGAELNKLNDLENKYKSMITKQALAGGKGKNLTLDALIDDTKLAFDKESKRIKLTNQSRRDAFADITEKGTLFGYSSTKKSAANQIRKGVKSKSDADKINELVEKLVKEKEAEKPKEEPKK